MKSEPVNFASLVNGAVTATVALICFLINASGETTALVMAAGTAWTAVINWVLARRNVIPVETLKLFAAQKRHPSRGR